MSEIRPPLARRALPWVLGAAFLVAILIAIYSMIGMRELAIDHERDRLQAFVVDQIASWEDALLNDLGDQLEAAALVPEQARLRQARLRKTRPWFNSLYLWRIPDERDRSGWMLFPPPATVDRHEDVNSRPCIRHANDMLLASVDRVRVAQELSLGCRNEGLLVRTHAAIQAAYMLSDAGQPAEALAALEWAKMPQGSLLDAAKRGMPPYRVAVFRYAYAELLLELGKTDRALDLLTTLGLQITELDAPDLAAPLQLLMLGEQGILKLLERNGRSEDAARMLALTQRAERRLVALREVHAQLLSRPSDPDAPPRWIRDQYSDTPFLLYFGWHGDLGVALQLEQQSLIANFLKTRMRAYRQHVTITDTKGTWVAGARRGGDFAASAPFSRTLSHLNVGIRHTALDATVGTINEQWMVPTVIIVVCAALGLTLIVQMARLTHRQYELLNRQRAFTTRVTHELKTPLAGIRLMAENLEVGAFRGDAQRREMARRIVEEADRLKARVDEVLAVAREHSIPSPEPFDPEEAILNAIDLWGPRLETAGVKLHGDLHPTDEILGDGDALRDAVGCLLDNALKYRDPEQAEPQVWLELRQDGKQIEISVADNGLGVPKPMRKAIFQRFVRVEGPNRGKSGGHGLGLNQVREIVEAHSGTIQCVEGVDGGARFVVRLPALRTA